VALALSGRPPVPLTESEGRRLAATLTTYPDIFRPVLLELLAEPLAQAIAHGIAAARASNRKAS
jgi:hypothetical protein